MKPNRLSRFSRLLLLAGSLLAARQLEAQFSVTAGNLYVYQIGDGTTAVAGAGAAPVYIDQFNTFVNAGNNPFSFQVALPTTGANSFAAAANSATEGELTLIPAGNGLTFGGYNGAVIGSASVNGQAVATVNRD